MPETVYHIRLRLARRGGNSFYLDHAERVSHTFCGAPVTEYDVAWASRNKTGKWTSENGKGDFIPCHKCVEAVKRHNSITGYYR